MAITGLGKMDWDEMRFIGLIIEGFLYGLYSVIFYMYIQYHTSKELGIDKRNVLLYAVCILYILSTVSFILDTTGTVIQVLASLSPSKSNLFRLQAVYYTSVTVNTLCDFISQGILIYRCWVIWGRNIRVIIIPSILSLAFLATWLAANGSVYIAPYNGTLDVVLVTLSGFILGTTALGISLTVNAAVTGLIVLRILKVYKQVKPIFEHRNGGSAGARLRSIMLIIIESGMAMFTIQLIRVVLTILQNEAFYISAGINKIFNGLTPTIILLRVSMGLSYHDEQSMVETVESLRFQAASQNENSISEPENLEIRPARRE